MILWKNVWYNLVTRNFSRVKYYWKGQHKPSYYPCANWSSWYYPFPLPWTTTQEDRLHAALTDAVKKLEFKKPLTGKELTYLVYHDPLIRFPERRSHRSTQQPDTPRQGEEEDADDQST